jgi:hypothetical protein
MASVTDRAPASLAGPDGIRSLRAPRWVADHSSLVAMTVYALLTIYFNHIAIEHLGSTCACDAGADATEFMWAFKWFPYSIVHGLNPLHTNLMWVPGGVNLAAVPAAPWTALFGLPFTLLFGPLVAYNVVAIAAPAVSAYAAFLLCRYVTRSPWASLIGGYTYGFSAFMFGQWGGDLMLMYIFVPPLMVLVVLKFMDGVISRNRAAAYLLLLVITQFGISTEVLFTFTCIFGVALVAGYALATPDYRKRIIEALKVIVFAYLLTGAIASYYILKSFQITPYENYWGRAYPGDVLAYFFPTTSFRLGSSSFAGLSASFAGNIAEQDQYLGWPLILILALWLVESWRRSRAAKVLAITTAVAIIFSLGDKLTVGGHPTIWWPFNLFQSLPVFRLLLPSRIGVIVSLGTAVAAALWIGAARGRRSVLWRGLLGVLAVIFLWPNLSNPGREANFDVPSFFTNNAYKHYLHKNEIVLPLPFGYSAGSADLLWQADADFYFRLAGGYWYISPPEDAQYPIVAQLQADAPGPQAAADLKSYVDTKHVSAIVVADGGAEAGWVPVITKAGWKLSAHVDGVQIYRSVSD